MKSLCCLAFMSLALFPTAKPKPALKTQTMVQRTRAITYLACRRREVKVESGTILKCVDWDTEYLVNGQPWCFVRSLQDPYHGYCWGYFEMRFEGYYGIPDGSWLYCKLRVTLAVFFDQHRRVWTIDAHEAPKSRRCYLTKSPLAQRR